jgi:hypothetical protein
MPEDKLYDIALQYKNTKLWKQLGDTELFALELSNGETGYCSVMGELGEHIALALYIGRNGLDSYRNMFEAQAAHSAMAQRELMLSQDCLQCSFENKDELSPHEIEEVMRYSQARGITFRGRKSFPQFQRFRPAHYPWLLKDKEDEKLLYEALSAALLVAAKLKEESKYFFGFLNDAPYNRSIPFLERGRHGYTLNKIDLPPRQKINYPSPPVRDELLVARLKQKKKFGAAWACEVAMFPSPISDEAANDDGIVELPEDAPFFPFMLLTADCKSELIVSSELVPDYDSGAEELVTALARAMNEHGIPSELQVRDKRTERLLSAFAGQLGIKIVRRAELPLLDDIEEDMLAQVAADQTGNEDETEQVFEILLQMNDKDFLSIPHELRQQLLALDNQGALPSPVSARLRRLFN